MKATRWNPAEFAAWHEASPLEKRCRVWEQLESPYKRLYVEWATFRRFASVVHMGVRPDNAITLDPDSSSPPPPDIACSVRGVPTFFELGEVVGQGLARAASEAEKKRESVFGGAVDIWGPLEYVLNQKCGKNYCAAAAPLHLVLYYAPGRQASFARFVADRLKEKEQWIVDRVTAGPFTKVWLYDDHEGSVLATFTSQGIALRGPAGTSFSFN